MVDILNIEFRGDRLLGIQVEAGAIIPLKPLVQGMGLDWPSQFKRLRRDPILSPAIVMMTMGSDPEAVCLPLDLVPGFLFRIDSTRVAVAVRGKVLAYQRECYGVLSRAFARPREPEPAPPAAQPIAEMPPGEDRKLVDSAYRVFGAVSAREVWFATGLIRNPQYVGRATPARAISS